MTLKSTVAKSGLREIEAQRIAVEILKRHGPPSIVGAETQVHPKRIRALHLEVHGTTARRGGFRDLRTLMKSKERVLQATLFAHLLLHQSNSAAMTRTNIWEIIRSYDLYMALHKDLPEDLAQDPIGFADCWLLAKNLVSGEVQFFRCAEGDVYLGIRESRSSKRCRCGAPVTRANEKRASGANPSGRIPRS